MVLQEWQTWVSPQCPLTLTQRWRAIQSLCCNGLCHLVRGLGFDHHPQWPGLKLTSSYTAHYQSHFLNSTDIWWQLGEVSQIKWYINLNSNIENQSCFRLLSYIWSILSNDLVLELPMLLGEEQIFLWVIPLHKSLSPSSEPWQLHHHASATVLLGIFSCTKL